MYKKIIYVTVLISLFFTGILTILPWVVSTKTVEKGILNLINKNIPGQISWNDLSFKLLGEKIQITDLTVITPKNDTAISLDTFNLEYNLLNLKNKTIHITKSELINPLIKLNIDKDGVIDIVSAFVKNTHRKTKKVSDKKQKNKSTIKIIVDSINVKSLAININREKPFFTSSIKKINLGAKFSLFPININANIYAEQIQFSDSIRNVKINSINTLASLDSQNIQLKNFDILTEQDSIFLSGKVDSYFTDSAQIITNLNSKLSAKTISNIIGKDLGDGTYSINMLLNNKLNNPTIKGAINYTGTNIFNIPFKKITLLFSLKDKKININSKKILFKDSANANISINSSVTKIYPNGFLHSISDFSLLSYKINANLLAPKISADVASLKNTAITLKINGCGIRPEEMKTNITLNAHAEINKTKQPIIVKSLLSINNGILFVDSSYVTINNNLLADINSKINFIKKTQSTSILINKTNLSIINTIIPNIDLSGIFTGSLIANGQLYSPSISLNTKIDSLNINKYSLGNINFIADIDSDSGKIATSLTTNGKVGIIDIITNGNVFVPKTFSILKTPILDVSIKNGIINLPSVSSGDIHGTGYLNGNFHGWIGNGYGNGNISLSNIFTNQIKIDTVALSVSIKDSLVSVNKFSVGLYDTTSIDGVASYNLDGSYNININSDTISLEKVIPKFPKELNIKAVTSISGKGFTSNPSAHLSLQIPGILLNENELGKENINIEIDNKNINVNGKGIIDINAFYNLSNKFFTAKTSVKDFIFDPICAILDHPEFTGNSSATFFIQGKNTNFDSANINIQSLNAYRDTVSFIKTNNLSVAYGKNGLKIDSFDLDLLSKGKVNLLGVISKDSIINLTFNANLPIEILEQFSSDIEQSYGTIIINGKLKDAISTPYYEGTVKFNDLSFTLSESQQKVQALSGLIDFDNNNIKVSSMTANVDDGHVEANGTINLDGKKVTSGDFKMNFINFPIVIPDILDLKLGGYLSVQVDSEYQGIGGNLELLECYYYQNIDPLPKIQRNEPKRHSVSNTRPKSVLDNVDLNVKIIPRSNIIIDNNLVYSEIKPDLTIGGKVTAPSILGRMNIVDGKINYLNRKFTITHGVVDFINPYEIVPKINIVSDSKINDYDITIKIEGIIGKELKYYSSSNPPLEDNEILALILTGQITSNFNSQDFIISQLTAAALDKLNTSVDIDISDKGLKIGDQLSRRLYTEYEMALENGQMKQVATILVKLLDQIGIRSFVTSNNRAGGEIRVNTKIR